MGTAGNVDTVDNATAVVDRLWRAYVPFQRGRDTSDDLTIMLAILMLASFGEVAGEPEAEFSKRWDRAVAEAGVGIPPLTDLRAALRVASRDGRLPLPGLLDSIFSDRDEVLDDVPWAAAFLAALDGRPDLVEAGVAEVCELLLERHFQEGTVLTGEFYTPRAVARLLVEMAAPQPGDRILDPACGTGGLLAAAARRIAGPGRADGASFEAYATDRSNPRLAMLNLALHGVDQPVVRASDPVSLMRSSGLVDRVVSNPPFHQRVEEVEKAAWPFGQPSRSNADFAWLQLAWSRLSDGGVATVLMPPSAAFSNNDRDAAIRREMIARGALLALVALPPSLFPRVSIAVHIWVLTRGKSFHPPADGADTVLFIDAGSLGKQLPRQPRTLTTADIAHISSRFLEWRQSPRTTPDEAGFSRSVSREEILENGGNLEPRLYVRPELERPTAELDAERTVTELDRIDASLGRSSAELRKALRASARLAGHWGETPRVSLRSILNRRGEGVFEQEPSGQLFAGPSGSLIRADDYVEGDGGVPVVMPRDLTDNGFSVESIRRIPEEQVARLDRFRLRRGDVVLARRGELGRCAVVRDEQQGWVCGTGCFVLRPSGELDADYLAAYLRGPEARAWLDAHSTNSLAMKTISLNVLLDLPIALPDLATQQSIGRVMTHLEDHERLLREQLELTRRIRRDALLGFQ